MNRTTKFSIIILRIVTGWFFLYQGIISILDLNWSLAPYIKGSQIFPHFYATLLEAGMLPYASYLAKGLFVAIGALLILGLFVRIASIVGILLTFIFYLPLVRFPYVLGSSLGSHYVVDEHIILIAVLLFLACVRAGEFFGMGTMFKFSRY